MLESFSFKTEQEQAAYFWFSFLSSIVILKYDLKQHWLMGFVKDCESFHYEADCTIIQE